MEERKASIRERMRYRLDNTFSRGTVALMMWLAVVTALLVVLAGVILAVTDVSINGRQGFIEGAWASLLRTLDPGTMGADVGWPFRVVALIVTLGGIFIVSTLIGLIATAMGQKLEELRKGRSPIVESGHTLILGWSPKLMTVISELMIANENADYSAIVVMSPRDKVAMEDEIRDRVQHNGRTRVVCRTGHVSDPQDLALVDPLRSKAVIVLNPEGESADAEVIRAVLALMQHDPGLQRLNVVAEMLDEKNAEALRMTAEGRLKTVVSTDIVAHITAQVCRQAGLSAVYQELLDFGGDEIYFTLVPNVVGLTFGESLLAFETSTILGIKFADGRIELNPPMDTVLAAGDMVIAIAEDDDKVIFDAPKQVSLNGGAAAPHLPTPEEHFLVLGWNYLGPRLLAQLDDYVAEGSTMHILYDPKHVPESNLAVREYSHLEVTLEPADTSTEAALKHAFETRRIDHVIVLCYRRGLSVAESDARTLMTLLQLRRLVRSREIEADADIGIVTELLDVKDVELARVADPDDFVVSEQLASLLLTQIAENPDLGLVFAQLFDSHNSDVMLKPASLYVPAGTSVPFYEVVGSARRFREIAIGYRRPSATGVGESSIVINPNKNAQVSFSEQDLLVVLTRRS